MGRRPHPRLPALAAAVVLSALLVACGDGGDSQGADAGSGGPRLPDVELVALDTEEPATWDAQGRPLVVNLWASWCAPCRQEMPAFQRVHERLGDQVRIVGVTDERDRAAAREAAEKSGARYPLVVDVDQELMIDLDVAGLPATVFVDEQGRIVGRHVGALTEDELAAEIEERYGIS